MNLHGHAPDLKRHTEACTLRGGRLDADQSASAQSPCIKAVMRDFFQEDFSIRAGPRRKISSAPMQCLLSSRRDPDSTISVGIQNIKCRAEPHSAHARSDEIHKLDQPDFMIWLNVG